jgi:hypothetical protein
MSISGLRRKKRINEKPTAVFILSPIGGVLILFVGLLPALIGAGFLL